MPRYYRRVIKIKAEDSPNVRLANAELSVNKPASNRTLVQGVVSYQDYLKRRELWDKIKQCICLDAEFYEGAELLLFPPEWLNRAEALWESLLRDRTKRKAKAIGIDPAEGGDKTAMTAVDELGIIEVVSKKTPDTSLITGEAIAFGRLHGVPPDKWVFDRGGGGKQHADRLRAQGFKVRTVAFGEGVTPNVKRPGRITIYTERIDEREERYSYVNRRAEMYHSLSLLMDPSLNPAGFSIPTSTVEPLYADLRKQLSVMPRQTDPEGRIMLPPKNRRPGQKETEVKTLTELIGHSPDEADSLVLAIYGMTHKVSRATAGVF